MKLYDEKEAVDFIKQQVANSGLSEDKIFEIIDAIYDFYDDNGELDLDFDDDDLDAEDESDEIISYVSAAFDDIDSELIAKIVKAELDYETSLLE